MNKTNEITQVTDEIYISDCDGGQRADLSAQGFNAVLCLDRKRFLDPHPDRGVECVLADLPDRRASTFGFDQAAAALAQLLRKYKKILVYCTHGQNRSVAVVAAYLVDCGQDSKEALDFVAGLRNAQKLIDKSFVDLLNSRDH
jgi:rhodanese-related sulfurtransferase